MTDSTDNTERLAGIRERLDASTQVEDMEGRVILTGAEARPVTWKYLRQHDRDIAHLLAELDAATAKNERLRGLELERADKLAELQNLGQEIEAEPRADKPDNGRLRKPVGKEAW